METQDIATQESTYDSQFFESTPEEHHFANLTSLYGYPPTNIQLFESEGKICFGREKSDQNIKHIIFEQKMFTKKEMFLRISKQHFYLERIQRNKPEFQNTPVLLTNVGRNGLFVNDKKLEVGDQKLLQDGDSIGLTRFYKIFKFSYRTVVPTKIPRNCPVFENYFVGDIIGSGGCGDVHVCFGLTPKNETSEFGFNTYALKVTKNSFNPMAKNQDKEEFINKIMGEVEIMKKLKNPNVLSLIEHYQMSTQLVIIVPFMFGGDLLNRILKSEKKRLSEDDSKFFFLQLMLGLKYMHAMEITHRDIKLDNILLNNSGKSPLLKISDFGLSKKLNLENNTICGTKVKFQSYSKFYVNFSLTFSNMQHQKY